jgi:hypothetical protein
MGSQGDRDKMREQGGQANQGMGNRQSGMDQDEDMSGQQSQRGSKGGNQSSKS